MEVIVYWGFSPETRWLGCFTLTLCRLIHAVPSGCSQSRQSLQYGYTRRISHPLHATAQRTNGTMILMAAVSSYIPNHMCALHFVYMLRRCGPHRARIVKVLFIFVVFVAVRLSWAYFGRFALVFCMRFLAFVAHSINLSDCGDECIYKYVSLNWIISTLCADVSRYDKIHRLGVEWSTLWKGLFKMFRYFISWLFCTQLIENTFITSRMTSATSKFVTAFDVIVVVGACLFGVFCGIVGIRHTQRMNQKLREVSAT